MSFTSGRVSYCRFRTVGDSPRTVDQTTLDILKDHAFTESDIGVPSEVEAGFTTGEHLFDVQFSYDKNGFGNLLLFAMRLDTNKVPSETRLAYKKINELAAADGNPTGFASKTEKREAAESAKRQADEDLAAGKFRKSKTIPIVWDLSSQMIYLGSSSPTAIEQAVKLFRDSFEITLDYISAGTYAGFYLRDNGKGRDYEDVHASAFTNPPAEACEDLEEAGGTQDVTIPVVPWVVKAVDLKDFLGNEFLIWLWWLGETADGAVTVKTETGGEQEYFIAIDKLLDMDCAWGVKGKQTLRADGPTRLTEAGEALATGKWPRKVGLILSDGEYQWELTLQGDHMSIGSATLPAAEDVQHPRELIEQRLQMISEMTRSLDNIYQAFIDLRIGSQWSGVRGEIRQWIETRRGHAVVAQIAVETGV